MDNKKWSKRFSTIFWWVLAFLPLFSALIVMIGYNFAHLNSIDNISSIQDYFLYDRYNNLSNFLEDQFQIQGSFADFIPPFIYDMFDGLFNTITPPHGGSLDGWTFLFAWATWIFIVHVIFDIIIWLPCFLHDLIDRFKK